MSSRKTVWRTGQMPRLTLRRASIFRTRSISRSGVYATKHTSACALDYQTLGNYACVAGRFELSR
jgi:hypothetical protein